ncbi:MAG: hypothetical protein A3F18_03430 [Legionellales bacterium RIFCSPHIGHO2_12_FULL_37_14]|nr:MAG: hypothetical protein A3F18_03430 [Legionellales bacterium RIFCSPHIGHO2_12_FULL_37_14]
MIQFATPYALFLLPLPYIILTCLPYAKSSCMHALPVPFFAFIATPLTKVKAYTKPGKAFYFFALLFWLLVFALAGPQWVGNPMHLDQQGRNIFLVLDVSGSMELPDMVFDHHSATRLFVVKNAATKFIEARKMDHLGLILFGSNAYLQTPLTYDHANLLKRVEDASVGLAGKTTSIGDAIGLAIKKLNHTPPKGRVIILLTDGANNSGILSPLKAAEIAKAKNIKIYTIGLSTEGSDQDLASLFYSMQRGADLDEDTLRLIAKTTNGKYFLATNHESLHKIYATIDKLETTQQRSAPLKPTVEYYPYLLAIFILLLGLFMVKVLNRGLVA